MRAKLKHLFTATRLPYVIILLVALCGVGYECNNIDTENQSANQTLNQWRTENVAKVHHNQHEILKYRIQLDALSDEKNAYLNRISMQSLLKNEIAHGNVKKTKLPNLSKSPEYMHLDQHSIIISNHANNRITDLQSDIRADRKAIHYDHSHGWFQNAMHPQKAPVFQKMAENGGGAGLLLIIALIFLNYTVKYKDIKLKNWRRTQDDARRQRYINEFGDDEGYNKDDKN